MRLFILFVLLLQAFDDPLVSSYTISNVSHVASSSPGTSSTVLSSVFTGLYSVVGSAVALHLPLMGHKRDCNCNSDCPEHGQYGQPFYCTEEGECHCPACTVLGGNVCRWNTCVNDDAQSCDSDFKGPKQCNSDHQCQCEDHHDEPETCKPTTVSSTDDPKKLSSGLNVGAIILITVGVIFGLILLVALVVGICCCVMIGGSSRRGNSRARGTSKSMKGGRTSGRSIPKSKAKSSKR